MQAIYTALKDVQRGVPVTEGELSVIPLLNESAPEANYLTFEAAVKRGGILVEELSESGSVPELFEFVRAGFAETRVERDILGVDIEFEVAGGLGCSIQSALALQHGLLVSRRELAELPGIARRRDTGLKFPLDVGDRPSK